MTTLADVARHAGVSLSTVSYALSGKRSISTDTRQRIEDSVRVLGYEPRRLTRNKTLALLLPGQADVGPMWLGSFLVAASTRARRDDVDLLLSATADATSAQEVDSLIIVSPATAPCHSSMPVVRVGTPDSAVEDSRVDVDRAAAGTQCATYLADLGHCTVAFLHRDPLEDFFWGFASAARALGCTVRTQVWQPGVNPVETHPSALVVADELLIGEVLSELDQRHLRVPQDVSVMALCSDETATRAPVAITSVGVLPETLGQTAVDIALSGARRTHLLEPRLTVRASTAVAPS
ncbi:LacI family DNA-binding transcriptional regulator [Saccharothrix texasensis]|uniref:DNA-binding LacI/PurR family transcriptional regulator n=1 Tax=Saccharothrix texasensis TaxID=103734 RepID=A0A3N1HH45_9PSEU|nr:LacI family DNA-binding transcriptional regulator [Saccharothrix texasensis]ROP41796.1 DNA-binding LacI/PurR family transcriptional regulator [Saccharothrix texasensis]